jgi:hypothetical protein
MSPTGTTATASPADVAPETILAAILATPAHLRRPAIAAVPAERTFRIKATTVDGHGRSMLTCAVCSWYGYYVSSRIGGRIGHLFHTADLAELTSAAAGHTCPSVVERAARQARRAARQAARKQAKARD